MYHNKSAADLAQAGFEKQFSKREVPDEVPELLIKSDKDTAWLPNVITATGITKSNGAAIRLIQQGGVKIDGETITDKDYEVPLGGNHIIKVGKKNYFRIGKR